MCHNLQHDPTPCKSYHTSPHLICLLWHTWLKSLKTDMACCSKCDNISRLPNINKAAVHSPQAWQIVLHDFSMILLRVTGTLLLSQRRLITLEATESKQAIIYQKTTLLLFYSPQEHQENFLQSKDHLCANSSGFEFEFCIYRQLRCTNKVILGCKFCGRKFIFDGQGHLSLSEPRLT